jgi:uncharacterized membrane protein YhhN
MKRKHLQLFYVIVAILDIVGLTYYEDMRFITKPALMIILMAYYFLYAVNFKILFLLALLFALMGDIFLLGEGFTYFLCGLGSFFIMQILYSFVFYSSKAKIVIQDILGSVFLLVYGAILITLLWPNLSSSLKLPVSLYSVAIIFMAYFAMIRKKSNATYVPVLLGSLLFIASDSLLALNEFTDFINHAGLGVMATYIAAQFLIVTGITEE